MRLPGTVKEVDRDAFNECSSLATLYLESGFAADLLDTRVPDETQVICLSVVLLDGALVQDLCLQKQVSIPEGTERIGDYWFWGSGVESVEIPASVREIGACAFYNCKNLKRVTLADNSGLEAIGEQCFENSGLEEMTLPRTLRMVSKEAFCCCGSLKRIYVEDGCEANLS